MPAHQLWMWLLLTALLSIAAMVAGVISSNQALAAMAGAMFAGVGAIVGWRFAVLDFPELGDHTSAARFARLIAATWAWAGLAMLACYYLTDLSWQHAWQYGAGMLIVAGLVWRYAEARTKPGSRFADATWVAAARWMTRMQGFAALAGVTILALSDKLDPNKQDWAANIVFVAGGLTIYALSMAALRAERRRRSA